MRVNIYTDGAASGNPGPGGYGVVLESGSHRKELSRGYRRTTNNRMELLAVIEGLKALRKKEIEVHVFSDSKYVVDAVNKGWLFNWERKSFKGKKNSDLWREFLRYYRLFTPALHWIKGHNNHPQNERCDELAVAAGQQPGLLTDTGFEQSEEKGNMFE